MQKSYFHTYTFNLLKGFAVVLLFILHFFASSDLWLPEFYCVEYKCFEEYFRYYANLCVAVFAFLTGYGFWFRAVKTFRHCFSKSLQILVVYWKVYAFLFFVAIMLNRHIGLTFSQIALEFIGFREDHIIGDIIAFYWYLPFYITSFALLTFLNILLIRKKNILRDIVYLFLMPFLIFAFLGNLCNPFFSLQRYFVDLMLWFPCVGTGFFAARYKIFEHLDDLLKMFFGNMEQKSAFLLSVVFLLFIAFGMHYYPGFTYYVQNSVFLPFVINMSVFYITFLIYAIVKLLSIVNVNYLRKLLAVLGSHSLYMWLFNGFF